MAKRLGVLAYASVGYAAAGVIVPVMLLFFGGWWLPRTVDRGPSTSTVSAVAIDLAAMSIFALQHSVMARPAVKRRLPASCERTTYVAGSCASIILLLIVWRPIGPVVWDLDGAARVVAANGFVLGFVVTYWATFTLGHTELLGLRQAWRWAVEGDDGGTPPAQLRVRGIYTVVRHPLMSGLLLCLWCAPTFTVGRLLLASAMTLYIFIGTHYEERDLRAVFGPAYDARVSTASPPSPRGGPYGGGRRDHHAGPARTDSATVAFDFERPTPVDWLAGSLAGSTLLDGYTILFPALETIMIRAVASVGGERADLADLDHDVVRDFIRQESAHARDHRRSLQLLEAQGFRVDRTDHNVRRFCEEILAPLSRVLGHTFVIGIYAGAEHWTAGFSAVSLEDGLLPIRLGGDGTDSSNEPSEMELLFLWHCCEELEHKAVVADVVRRSRRPGGHPGGVVRCARASSSRP